MDLLREEILKKRKQLEKTSLIDEKKKFFKRKEFNEKFDEEYWQKQAEKQVKIQKKNNSDNKNNDDDNNDKNNENKSDEIVKLEMKKWIKDQTGQSSIEDHNKNGEERILPRKEVIKRLRERNQPITLFGENEIDSFRRLRKLEIIEPDSIDKGFRNDFQEAMEKVDAAYMEEIVKSGGQNTNDDKKRGKNDVKIEEMNTTIEEILEQAQFLGKQRSKRPSINDDEQRKSDCMVILKFLKFLFELWGKRLNDRNDCEKHSTHGRLMNAIYTQTQEYLQPLFKQLKKQTIADDILKHLIIIIKYLLERDYVHANDAYLQMAIGNAPWPIGVTMVGIHARTGREKIFAQNIAHVLNDETQRKYIQAIKRLMTQCQKIFPTDPSKCVEYTKEE